MKAVIQRVSGASVEIDREVVGACRHGLMILLGVAADDTEAHAELLAQKVAKLRIFCDENGKMNRCATDVGADALVVSNFTLLADTSHGNRPSFLGAGDPAHAEKLYLYFIDRLRDCHVPTQSGRFGADMMVHIDNDGPVTLLLDTEQWLRPASRSS